jgi:hypothetical protein
MLMRVPIVLAVEPAASPKLAEAEAVFADGVKHKAQPEQACKFFAHSAKAWENLYQHGYRNADLCRNWGQAEYLADQLPQAILAWRLGQRFAPNDPGLQADLEYARDQVEYPTGNIGRPAVNAWPGWLPWPGANGMLLFSLCAYAACWLFGTWWAICRQPAVCIVTIMALAVLTVFVTGSIYLFADHRDQREYPLVVVVQAHPLRQGNGNSYPPHDKLSVVRPGMEARLLFRRGDWLQIELAGGHIGWIPTSAGLIEPTPSALGEPSPTALQ